MSKKGFIHFENHQRFDLGVVVFGVYKVPMAWLLSVAGLITGVLMVIGIVGTFTLPRVPYMVGDSQYTDPNFSLFAPAGYWFAFLGLILVLIGLTAFARWTRRSFAVAQRSS